MAMASVSIPATAAISLSDITDYSCLVAQHPPISPYFSSPSPLSASRHINVEWPLPADLKGRIRGRLLPNRR